MMHPGEVRADADQVARLVRMQFPQWADLPVSPVAESGTDHYLFRLGEQLVARMPKIDWAVDQADSDSRWLPQLAPHLPLPVPVPLAVGQPGQGFPWPWSVAPWLVGETPTAESIDPAVLAADLGGFVVALQAVDPTGGPLKTGADRGVPLAAREQGTQEAITELGNRVDTAAVTRAWTDAITAPAWDGDGVWLHGDLLAGNLLVRDRRLAAVIDWGALGVGDPAADIAPAWNLLPATARDTYRRAVGCDDATWRRGRGWALSTALVALPYYWNTAPRIAAHARHTIAGVLDDLD